MQLREEGAQSAYLGSLEGMVSNAEGLEITLVALGDRLDEDDEALVALARGLAVAVDSEPKNAALWREYRAAVAALSEVVAGGDVDDDTADFLVSIRTPRASLGHPKDS